MDREQVIRNLRACLLSTKGGLRLEALSQDYKTLVGENIPFKQLGFPSLVAFLQTVPGIRAVNRGGQCIVEAVPTQESAHIAKLIAQQKQSSKKGRKKVLHVSPRKPVTFRAPVRITNYPPPIFHPPVRVTTYPPRVGNGILHPPPRPQPLLHQAVYPPPLLQQNRQQLPPVYQQNHQLQQNQRPLHVYPPSQPVRQPLKPQQTEVRQATYTVQVAMKEHLDLRNGIAASSAPPANNFQVLSPLSPAKLLSGPVPQPQPKPVATPPVPTSTNAIKKPVPKSLPAGADPRLELRARANALNLPAPEYKILPTLIKNNREPTVFARVTIGPHGYGSYPKEARTEEEAQKIAAEVALSDFTEIYGLPSDIVETTDKNLIRDRVLAIIDSHSNGVFMHQIPVLYKQQHSEFLPSDWQSAIEKCPAITLESGADKSIILRRFSLPTTPTRSTVSPKKDTVPLNPIGLLAPGNLKLPDENDVWIVLVNYVFSTVEVWVRLVDDVHNEKFDAMSTEMAEFYSKAHQSLKSPPIEMGGYYAIFVDDSWHRVRCIDHDLQTGQITVSFIDLGDEDRFHYSKLYALDKQFCLLPAQAFRVSLHGLEDFSDCDCVAMEIMKHLLERAFYVEVVNCDDREDGPCATVIFYDTDGPDDVNLNAVFLKQILESIVTVPKLDADLQDSKVFVSHIEKNGDIYVQVQSDSMKCLIKMLNRLISTELTAEDIKNHTVTNIDVTKVYLVSVDGNWYRGKVVGRNFNEFKICLIDFGKTVTIEAKGLVLLERLSETLARYPSQALKVHLNNIDESIFNEKMAARLRELAPEGEPILVKVVTSSDSSIPVVELFKRIQPSNMLVSINTTLVYEEELNLKHQGDGNNNIKPRKRIERMNSRSTANEDDECSTSLKPPKISGIGDFFDVYVTMASHPGNFTVQPLQDRCALQKMMLNLQQTCSAYNGPPPSPQSVKPGKLFAAKHKTDGDWYRVCISSVIPDNMVSVYFCDFGDVSVMSISQLQPLKSKFFELPYQAIKARLAGVRPVNIDWSVKDTCRFRELVVEKKFVSKVVECVPDGVSPADTVLGLKLINVDTNEDIHIDEILVKEGRAVFVDA